MKLNLTLKVSINISIGTSKVFCIFGPNLVILAWTGPEWNFGQARIDTHTQKAHRRRRWQYSKAKTGLVKMDNTRACFHRQWAITWFNIVKILTPDGITSYGFEECPHFFGLWYFPNIKLNSTWIFSCHFSNHRCQQIKVNSTRQLNRCAVLQ